MATLVLTAVGSAIGGPVGGAIGGAIGQQIDNVIFAPKARQGPRLKELAVQTSSYGTQVPAIFGAMRVAGTVIWATDLIERRSKSGGGKGRPATVNYSYSVSMAVALSSRPILRVGRIWADGNLLRGSAGDLKVDTQLRIHNGDQDQPLDPLMASAEQAGQCPAHRGLAYAMFEDLQLADYGNRIPSLTFEIFERDGEVPVHAIFAAATGGRIAGSSRQNIAGFALSGASAQEPLAVLLDTMPVELAARNGILQLGDPDAAGQAWPIMPVINENGVKFDQPRQTMDAAGKLPSKVTLRYYDGDRDFQASLQQSERGEFGRNILDIELPAVLGAATAKALVEYRHLDLQYNNGGWRGEIALATTPFFPGSHFIDGAGIKWRIEQVEHRQGSLGISARAIPASFRSPGSAVAPGRNIPSPDAFYGETRTAVIELPASGMADPAMPVVAVFAAGTSGGWRRAALSLVSGEALTDIGATAAPAIMGILLDPLPAHNTHLLDESASFRVQLLNDAMDIPERSGSPLDHDASPFWLGDEFVRVGTCTALGNGIYRLSRLLRGCFRSAAFAPSHLSGERIVFIEAAAARVIEERVWAPADFIAIEAFGLGDAAPVSGSIAVSGIAVTPLPPVHGRGQVAADGTVSFYWIRRSRIDPGWRDGVDQMMAEQQEEYRFSLIADDAVVAEFDLFENAILWSAAEWSALGIAPDAAISAQVRQIGRHAQSEPLSIALG